MWSVLANHPTTDRNSVNLWVHLPHGGLAHVSELRPGSGWDHPTSHRMPGSTRSGSREVRPRVNGCQCQCQPVKAAMSWRRIRRRKKDSEWSLMVRWCLVSSCVSFISVMLNSNFWVWRGLCILTLNNFLKQYGGFPPPMYDMMCACFRLPLYLSSIS